MSIFEELNMVNNSIPLSEKLGYSRDDKVVIVNIDDVGMHEDELNASIKVIEFGMVKTGSIMVPCNAFDNVAAYWKKNQELDFGIHLTLTCEWGTKSPWSPVLPYSDVPSLYNPERIMWPDVPQLLRRGKKVEIEKELEEQIRVVLLEGLQPTHIDDHMDLHNSEFFFPILMNLSRKYHLPMRVWKRKRYRYPILKNNLISLRNKGFIFPDSQKGIYYMGGNDQSYEFRKKVYHDYLKSLQPGVHNIKIHVGLPTDRLNGIYGSEIMNIRKIDFDVWTSEETMKLAEGCGITFIGYRPLQILQEKTIKK